MEEQEMKILIAELSMTELNQLQKLITEKKNELYKALQEQERKKKITALKIINRGDPVYFVGRYVGFSIPYGSELIKVKDARVNMVVEFNGKKWNMPYKVLTPIKPSEDDIRTNKLTIAVFSRF